MKNFRANQSFLFCFYFPQNCHFLYTHIIAVLLHIMPNNEEIINYTATDEDVAANIFLCAT